MFSIGAIGLTLIKKGSLYGINTLIYKPMSAPDLQNVRIVLVGTTHPGNIGAAARAMKTMQMEKLVLVSPKIYPSAECTARAAGADDLLHQAEVHDSLEQAIHDCNLVYGTTARERSIEWPVLDPRQASEEMINAPADSDIAILFGREQSGLSNEEMDLCHRAIRIPANPHYSSLNIAAAVQIVSYEVLMQRLNQTGTETEDDAKTPLATHEEMDRLYEHLQTTMTEVGFFDPEKPRRLMRRMRRLFNRAQLDNNEYNILRGFLAAVREKMQD
ncbi:MAG: RNA methyltransferase [Thiotrichales bacterium]|nr:RNA methyltransferase [Thiotrichales bacterium]